jgi:SAM-dependent methyltransferase
MDQQRAGQFMQKVVGDVATTTASVLVYLGDKVGLFKAMAGAGAMSASEFAERTGLHPRYAEEWLAAMTCAGYVEHDPQAETFTLPDEHALFLTNPKSEYYLGGLFAGLAVLPAAIPRLIDAYQRGTGVPFSEYGEQNPFVLEQLNRSVYESRLVRSWLPTVPGVVERLQAGGSVLDVGCGTGVVPILLAKAFPSAKVVGLDLDAHSIELARSAARADGVADRVTFVNAAAESLPSEPKFDLVTSFDVVHELANPRGVLERIRACLPEGGTYLMVEPRADDRLEKNRNNPFCRMLYGMSCLTCVPVSLAQGGPGLGAMWGPGKARELAREAGFSQFQV